MISYSVITQNLYINPTLLAINLMLKLSWLYLQLYEPWYPISALRNIDTGPSFVFRQTHMLATFSWTISMILPIYQTWSRSIRYHVIQYTLLTS